MSRKPDAHDLQKKILETWLRSGQQGSSVMPIDPLEDRGLPFEVNTKNNHS